MIAQDALLKKIVTLTARQTVEEALALFREKKIRSAPVVDDDDKLAGYFSLRHLMRELLPVSVSLESGVRLPVGAAPGLDKRLKKLMPQPVDLLMEREVATVLPDTPHWDVIALLIEQGRPLPVVADDGVFQGLVTEQSVLERLENAG